MLTTYISEIYSPNICVVTNVIFKGSLKTK